MSTANKPTVLIVGAGMGGLMLGALLEKSNIPYMIFERAAAVKPLGSAMTVGPTLLPLFQQLGIYDEFLTIGKVWHCSYAFKESMKPLRPFDYRPFGEFTGYGQYIVARPKLYDLILRQVPAHKINFGHRVLNISEEEGKVSIHLSDNRVIQGDIIVGADGAYSAVRQRMYEQLKAKGELPKSDQEDLPFSCTCLIGQTKPFNPEQYQPVGQPTSIFNTYIGGKKPYSWHTFTTAQNTIAYMVVNYLDSKSTKVAMEQRFRHTENSEWGAHTAQSMCDETRDFPLLSQDGKKHTLGDLYDLTPKELISKVMLEEKVFQTWYSGRFVLLGDACHKLHPAGGHGAMTAIHDAIALANLLYAMPTTTDKDIAAVFKDYRTERFPAVMESYNYSHRNSKISGSGFTAATILFMFNHLPHWLWRLMLTKTIRFRPQVGFLEAIKIMGSVVPAPSPSEQKARAVFEMQKQMAHAV
ncbi:hypothetical protein FBU30_005598 [Linnemannia zychae]|nr:hypothetical protein FBU30_005598 [Linnemannia zychae]